MQTVFAAKQSGAILVAGERDDMNAAHTLAQKRMTAILDFVIANARLPWAEERTVDIGIAKGRVATPFAGAEQVAARSSTHSGGQKTPHG